MFLKFLFIIKVFQSLKLLLMQLLIIIGIKKKIVKGFLYLK